MHTRRVDLIAIGTGDFLGYGLIGPLRARLLSLLIGTFLASFALLGCEQDDGNAIGDVGDGSTEVEQSQLPDGGRVDSGQVDRPDGSGQVDWPDGGGVDGALVDAETISRDLSWFERNTISHRVSLPMTGKGTILDAQTLVNQLAGYDPGSLLRCAVSDDPDYQEAIDAIGGVTWGYGVQVLEDQSKPRFQAGLRPPMRSYPPMTGAANDAAGETVVIEKPDVVAVTDSAALFYSDAHGLLMVNTAADEPTFECATQLPGRVNQFFFHDGHLIAMTQHQQQQGAESFLLHFEVSGTTIRFVESVNLGQVNILDSRRFNERLVFYTDYSLPDEQSQNATSTNPNSDVASGLAYEPPIYQQNAVHRALRVFKLGATLQEEMYDTLIDTTRSEDELYDSSVTPDTPLNSIVNESRSFGRLMWASDHYFVVTQEISTTKLSGWRSNTYSVCTASHTVETQYQYCWTEYETRPNPDYKPADNSGGDRSCHGTTLSDCLVEVARVSNQTIQVPVGRKCEQRTRSRWICDARESRTVEYPTFLHESSTQLYIYEYTENGFIRLDSKVHEITNQGLESVNLNSQVDVLTTSTESYDLAVPGSIQTLRFQNGFLYVISQGVLQVYAMGGSSIVRTATLPVVNDTLQSSLFSRDRLFLSDFDYSYRVGDTSVLRVVNLTNPAFPTVEAATRELPGGHRSIIASLYGIFTIGTVQQFQGQNVNVIKLGLFSDPYVAETAYLILGTDLSNTQPAVEEAQLFDGSEQRLLLPYFGQTDEGYALQRVGVSRVESDDIVSEGAVVTPEPVTRVRRVLNESPSYLAFSTNAIEWLRPNGSEWSSTAVLEYFQPAAVYRLNEEDDYVEIQRLGDRCQLYFSNATDINQRDRDSYSELFDCRGGGYIAYDRILLIGSIGLEFDEDYEIRLLTEEEIQEVRDAIAERETCLLSTQVVTDLSVDYYSLPDRSEVTCVTPVQLQELQNAVDQTANTP